ncbi:putative dehydrogenase [Kribbella sp. VKM Ac-2571]|uniref:Gfo/Idh/MocA family protein n=1 Tax=Kribbella sp. VKM Ac-2571 TaxID=2512222 RepID=UPI00105C1833|nr:Gfo/Idh/MocA family oxidoreductase [Kribbella sp. VKM Ac-2571]TDO56746.1 putative dehydrogenase [Kribbella sp. VKM Ac-2571]
MVTIGIVGAGLRGRLFAEALDGQPDVSVVALAEPSAKVAEEARVTTGLPVTGSHAELLEAFDPDAVIVATPDFAHRQVAVDLAEAGKHLLIEKPVATTLDDARAIAAAIHRSGVRCLVGFENRWNPHVVQAKAAMASVGEPVTASASLSNSFFVPTTMLSWAAESSPAWFLMPHTVDLVLWLTDRRAVSVSAVGSRGVLAKRGVDTWDVVHALVTFDDGSTATLSSAWTLPDAGDGIVDFRFQVIGTEGSVTADLSHQGLTVVSDKYRSVWPLSGRIGRSQVGPAVWMVQDFAAGLVDGGDLGPGIDHGVLVTQIICAIEDSIRTGQTVQLTAPAG